MYLLPIVGHWVLSFLYIGTVLSKSWFVFAESKNYTLTDGNFYAGQKLGLWKVLEFNEDLTRVSKLAFAGAADTEGILRKSVNILRKVKQKHRDTL